MFAFMDYLGFFFLFLFDERRLHAIRDYHEGGLINIPEGILLFFSTVSFCVQGR